MDKKRILIADDQADVLEALRFLLKAEGYQTDAVSSPLRNPGAVTVIATGPMGSSSTVATPFSSSAAL